MGVDIDFDPGPVIRQPVRTPEAVHRLRVPACDEVAPFVADAIRLIRPACAVPLISFAGAPLTLAAYLVQSGGSASYLDFRTWPVRNPALARELLDKLTDVTIGYLRMQVGAGAQAIQIFDSWAGTCHERGYAAFGLPYTARVLHALAGLRVPRIYHAVRGLGPQRLIHPPPPPPGRTGWSASSASPGAAPAHPAGSGKTAAS